MQSATTTTTDAEAAAPNIDMDRAQRLLAELRDNIERVFVGKPEAVSHLLIALLARGHILIEDMPGVGKTILARSLAMSIDCSFNRVQLTPDLLPSDIVGVSIYNERTQSFEFIKGPIFTHVLLADEINRTTPRTQAALHGRRDAEPARLRRHLLPARKLA